MAEEDQEELEKDTDIDKEGEREYSDVEREAMERGWDPDFEGDETKRAISAEEFLDRQRLYDDLKRRGKENKRLQKAVDELKQSHRLVADQAYKRAKRELEKEKRNAYEEGDTTRALEIDKEMKELDDTQEAVSSGGETSDLAAEAFESFREENPWYDKDPELRGYADMIGSGMINMNPGKAQSDPESLFQEVSAEVKRRFPEKFEGHGTSRRKKDSGVEGDRAGKGGRGKKHSLKDLPEEHREVAKRIVETGVMSEEEYVRDYFGEQ